MSEARGQWPESGKFEIRNPKSEIGVLPHGDVVNAVSRYELSGYMTNTLLRDTDQMSMAHALEVRVPFIDSAVVSFVLGLPGEWKLTVRDPNPFCSTLWETCCPRKSGTGQDGIHSSVRTLDAREHESRHRGCFIGCQAT